MTNGELSTYLILPDALWSSDRLRLTEIFTIYLLGVKIGGQQLRPTTSLPSLSEISIKCRRLDMGLWA
jgi:hypothetical protein